MSGGPYGAGTVFSLDPKTHVETALYSFCSENGCADGAYPEASLLNVKGTLYGTTSQGGTVTTCYYGCGTAFSLDPATGAEKVLPSFGSGVDGEDPWGALTRAETQ